MCAERAGKGASGRYQGPQGGIRGLGWLPRLQGTFCRTRSQNGPLPSILLLRTVIRNESKAGLNFDGVSRVLLSHTLDPADGHSWTDQAADLGMATLKVSLLSNDKNYISLFELIPKFTNLNHCSVQGKKRSFLIS
jgi:hypothetical protein